MIFVGDLHGQWRQFLHTVQMEALRNKNFIQVGDFGLGFYGEDVDRRHLSQMDETLGERNNKLYIVRGNHDKKSYWDDRSTLALQNIVLAQDLELLEIDEKKVLFVGGGISIDRLQRTIGKDYWLDEVVSFDITKVPAICKDGVDIVVTHVAPIQVWPYHLDPVVFGWLEHESRRGRDLQADLEDERKRIGEILQPVKDAGCKHWYYGHYHQTINTERDGIQFHALGIHAMYDAKRNQFLGSGK